MAQFSKEQMEVINAYLADQFNNFIGVYKALMEHKGYIDDHNYGARGFIPHNDYVILWNSEGKHICPIYKNSVCCLNPLYLDEDGKVHLSTRSIGSNVEYGDIARHNNRHGIVNRVHRFASLECCQYFSTEETEENMPW